MEFYTCNNIVLLEKVTYFAVILVSFLSLAEAHAGDDRSDASPDEDEIGRVRVGAGKKHVISPRPVRRTHTHVCIHTRSPGPSTFIHSSIHPCVQEHIITTLFLLQKNPSIICSAAYR